MTAPLALAAYASVMATVGAGCLRRSNWPDRSPRLGIVAWQVLTASIMLSVVLAGAAVAFPTVPASASLADFLQTCALALRQQYATPGGVAMSVSGAALAVIVVGRAGHCLVTATVTTRRSRRAQRQALALVARRHGDHGVLLVEHAAAVVYCMPGRGREVVMTTAALEALDEEQTEAVLAHEHAHLRARHDLVVAAAEALRRAFPRVATFDLAHTELLRLVEMHADDVASRRAHRSALATAVVLLAGGAGPAGTLAAAAEPALARVRRLVAGPRPLSLAGTTLTVVLAAATLVAPLVIVAAPAVVAVSTDLCPLGFPAAY